VITTGCAVLLLGGGSQALAAGGGAAARGSGSANASSGGAGISGPAHPRTRSTKSHPTVPGTRAKIIHGIAYAPAAAPIQVQRAIWAGNKIRTKPYIYGGGHGSFNDSGYDCSGSVSYVLHGAGLLSTPMDSSEFMSWDKGGQGHWMTVYTSPAHAFIVIAGIVFDTSHYASTTPGGSGPRWQPESMVRSQLSDGNSYAARHPAGY